MCQENWHRMWTNCLEKWSGIDPVTWHEAVSTSLQYYYSGTLVGLLLTYQQPSVICFWSQEITPSYSISHHSASHDVASVDAYPIIVHNVSAVTICT